MTLALRLRMRPVLAVLSLSLACATPFAPQNAEPFTPPAQFADWWSEMEACSGVQGDWQRVTWYVVPTAELRLDGEHKLGVWDAPHAIYLASEVVHHTDGRTAWQPWAQTVAQHEMLHDLTGPDHGAVFDRCGARHP